MNGTDFLVDTNILIRLFNGDKALGVFLQGKNLFMSFITEMELLSKPRMSPDEVKLLENLIRECVVIDLNQIIKQDAIYFRKSKRLKLPDAIVASTAKYLKLPFLSSDSDFKGLEGIELIQIEN
jgi:predicted nucleic acid-binding protein